MSTAGTVNSPTTEGTSFYLGLTTLTKNFAHPQLSRTSVNGSLRENGAIPQVQLTANDQSSIHSEPISADCAPSALVQNLESALMSLRETDGVRGSKDCVETPRYILSIGSTSAFGDELTYTLLGSVTVVRLSELDANAFEVCPPAFLHALVECEKTWLFVANFAGPLIVWGAASGIWIRWRNPNPEVDHAGPASITIFALRVAHPLVTRNSITKIGIVHSSLVVNVNLRMVL
jgi:hypothetical protein